MPQPKPNRKTTRSPSKRVPVNVQPTSRAKSRARSSSPVVSEDSDSDGPLTADRPQSLHDGAILKSTALGYSRALDAFRIWWNSQFAPLPTGHLLADATPQEMDTRLGEYLEMLYQDNACKSIGANLICSIQHQWPHLSGNLNRSWRLLKAWFYICPGICRRPWPPELVLALIAFALIQNRDDVAVAYMLPFHCLL